LDKEETLDRVDVNWTRMSRFPPFMKMGGKEGYLVYHCTGFKLPQGSTANDLHTLLATEINDRLPVYAKAADEYDPSVKNVSSWTYFRDNFDTYLKNEETWPIPSPSSS
jgi:hypothetical protein